MTVKVLELYSGIGGMHAALSESEIPFEIVAAADINTVANEIYHLNYPLTKIITRTIEAFTVTDFEKLSPDMILMSPPCQPYTRVGKQLDSEDPRAKSFLHLLTLLSGLSNRPSYILLENVKGFDSSHTRDLMLQTLWGAKYEIQEFLLTPLQFGIPNARLRYYMLAKRLPLKFNWEIKSEVWQDIPPCVTSHCQHRQENHNIHSLSKTHDPHTSTKTDSSVSESIAKEQLGEISDRTMTGHCYESLNCDVSCASVLSDSDRLLQCNVSSNKQCDTESKTLDIEQSDSEEIQKELELPLHERYLYLCRPIRDFLEEKSEEYFQSYMLPEKFYRRFWVMDIVQPESPKCICFTKGYAHHIEGTGSILQVGTGRTVANLKKEQVQNPEIVAEVIKTLKLRFFTPREVANLMCFPSDFKFPEEFNNRQLYRVLGNSLNVHVVSILIRTMCHGDR